MKSINYSASCLCWLVAITIVTAATSRAQTLAFPGAQGFGANATGGRAGTVYHVTTLADSGAGSFRDAVSVANRIVVFDVGGYITLSSEVAMQANITIAGQTAPGGGIGIRGAEVSFGSQNNIIVRHLRFRPGSASGSSDNGLNFYQAHNVILDHVSIEFAKWNNIDAATGDWQTHPIADITVQNSIIADPIGQQFGAHTEAPNGTWSWFNNLFANSHNRNPLAKVNTVFINNVLYNCDAGYTTHTSTSFNHDIVNNYFVAGPASGGNFPWYQIDNNQSIYFSGNLKDSSLDGVLNGSTTVPLPGYQGGGTVLGAPWSTVTTAYPTVSSASALRRILSQSGALPRDQMDGLVVSQAQTLGSGTTGLGAGTRGPDGALYTTETQTGLGNGGFGTITGGTRPTDTDNDGMPDFWERTFGWNINSADSMVIDASGYTRLEEYLNWLADPHVAGNGNSTIDLDLNQYASGFVNSPAFSVSNPVNGTVALLADGHTARFTPNAGFYGLGSYKFIVTDSAGSAMTLTVGVLSQPAPPASPAAPTATAGNAQVSLSWSTAAGATGYQVNRSTGSSSGPYSVMASVAGTSYLNTGLVNGTTYFYTITATNAFGSSAPSAYRGATPTGTGGGVTNTIQAEAGTVGGGTTIDSNNAGFNGTGFANFSTTGGFLQFNNVAGGSGGAGTLTIRYALGITTSRTGQLVVNGVTNSITFNPSGAWTTWTNKVVNITLGAGTTNVIRFQSNGQDLGNIDQITVAKP
jgi:hypothetical protein